MRWSMTEHVDIPSRVHIVGAGGAGMSGLAKILSQLGHSVTGSDVKPGRMFDALNDVGITTWLGHRPEKMKGVQLVVASSAVPPSDPEIAEAKILGIEVWERPRLLAALTRLMPTVGFAGTHGKTTSTALAVRALRGSGLDPSFLVGGEMLGLNTGAHVGGHDLFVLEADEAFGTFRHLALNGVLVTNIEADHLDFYGTVAALEESFAQVVGRVTGPRVGCIDDHGVARLAQAVPLVTYGFSPSAVWRVVDHRHTESGQQFKILRGRDSVDVSLPKPGAHLALNAAGVLVLLSELGYDMTAAANALAGFVGVARRYEVRGRVRGITIVDDYAHHPTEVAATIAAAALGAEGRVIAVFQPHRFSRTADLGPQFGSPLALADHTIVTDVYPAGEVPIIGVSGRIILEATRAAGGAVTYAPDMDDIPKLVADIAREGDIVLVMGAGDITSVTVPIAAALESAAE